MREVRANSKCPCESGRRYGACCKRKQLKWLVDELGEFHKQVKLAPEAVEAIKHAATQFRHVFERDPKRDRDPVFLWKYLVSDEELSRQSEELMRQAGVSPHIIYAHQKTGGLLLTRENESLATTKDVEDWHAAIDEYFQLQKNPPKPDAVELSLQALEDEIDSCIICLGYVLEHGLEPDAQPIQSSSEYFTVDEYVLLCATKCMKSLRSIKALLDDNIGADSLSLARHLLENYFHIIFARARPEMLKHLVDGVIGLKLGTHEFARTTNGRVDSRRIIRKSDGVEYIGHISYYKMAEVSPRHQDLELFDYMYSFLSEYTHPSLSGLQLVTGERGNLDPLTNELQAEAMTFSVCFSAMVLDELRNLPVISQEAKIDIGTVVRRVSSKAQNLFGAIFQGHPLSKSFEILSQRLQALGTPTSESPP